MAQTLAQMATGDRHIRVDVPCYKCGKVRSIRKSAISSFCRTCLPGRKPNQNCSKCGTVIEPSRRHPGKCRPCYLASAKYYQAQSYHHRLYGISRVEFNDLFLSQEGKCRICQRKMNRPHTDHDHVSGRVRGLLCSTCNTGLGSFGDMPEVLRRAADYLEGK
jgi:hypothetical protein